VSRSYAAAYAGWIRDNWLSTRIFKSYDDIVDEVVGVCPEGDSRRVGISVSSELAPYLAAKGSITVDGVSLTVNEV
jgi:riboflavin synthase